MSTTGDNTKTTSDTNDEALPHEVYERFEKTLCAGEDLRDCSPLKDAVATIDASPRGARVALLSDGKWHAWCPAHDRYWIKPYYRPRVFKTQGSAQKSADGHDREHHHAKR